MKVSGNILNFITFYPEKEYIIPNLLKTMALTPVKASTLIQPGYDVKELGYSGNDILYLDKESYKNFRDSQTYYESNMNAFINDNENISNIRNHK